MDADRLTMPLERRKTPAPSTRLHISKGSSDGHLLGDLRDLRSRFVVSMGWFDEGHHDGDHYDQLDDTYHLAIKDVESDSLLSALRLTQTDCVEKSLSWSMLSNSEDEFLAQAQTHSINGEPTIYRLNAFGSHGNLWDLTRLVNPLNSSISASKIAGSMLALFGAGVMVTAKRGGLDLLHELRWIFVTTPPLKAFLDRAGIMSEIIAHGKVSRVDQDESYLCVTEPVQVMRFLHSHSDEYQFTVKHVTHGFREVCAPQSFAL